MGHGPRRADPDRWHTMTGYLRISHGVSRGRETYGYNIVTLTDETSHPARKFRCMGGGYDMVGTVLADWLVATHPDKLDKLTDRAHATWSAADGYQSLGNDDRARDLYGMTVHYGARGEIERVTVDGACGVESVQRIIRAAGLQLTRTHDRRGNTTGWIVAGDES